MLGWCLLCNAITSIFPEPLKSKMGEGIPVDLLHGRGPLASRTVGPLQSAAMANETHGAFQREKNYNVSACALCIFAVT